MFGYFRPIVLVMKEEALAKYYKDLIHQTPESVKLPAGALAVLDFLTVFINTPLIRVLLRRSFFLVCYAMVSFRKERNYAPLYRLLIGCLLAKSCRSNPKQWWYCMRAAVAFVQARQHHSWATDIDLEDNLIRLGNRGPQPLVGYDVAYVFVGYSLWLFERGEVGTALRMISIAEKADPSWGYPSYLHGWYQLFGSEKESVDYFVRAVHIDWSFLRKMKEDNICREHPQILHEVRRRTLVSK